MIEMQLMNGVNVNTRVSHNNSINIKNSAIRLRWNGRLHKMSQVCLRVHVQSRALRWPLKRQSHWTKYQFKKWNQKLNLPNSVN